MSESSALAGFFVGALLGFFAGVLFMGFNHLALAERDELRATAVKRGHAEWVVGADNKPLFQWKVQVEK